MNLIDIESLNIKEIEDIVSLASQFRSDIGGFNQEPIYGDKKVGILFLNLAQGQNPLLRLHY